MAHASYGNFWQTISQGAQAAQQTAKSPVEKVILKTTILPDIVYNPNAEPTFVGKTITGLVKPQLIVETPIKDFSVAPRGEPRFNVFPLLLIGGAMAVVGTVVTVGWLSRQL